MATLNDYYSQLWIGERELGTDFKKRVDNAELSIVATRQELQSQALRAQNLQNRLSPAYAQLILNYENRLTVKPATLDAAYVDVMAHKMMSKKGTPIFANDATESAEERR